MMKTRSLFLCLLASIVLQGCTHYVWVKPSGDPATFNTDNYGCQQNAMASAPPVFQVYEAYPTHYGEERVITHCKDRGNMEICKTRVIGSPYAPSPPQTIDLNERNRSNLYDSCMGAHGWQLQAVEDK